MKSQSAVVMYEYGAAKNLSAKGYLERHLKDYYRRLRGTAETETLFRMAEADPHFSDALLDSLVSNIGIMRLFSWRKDELIWMAKRYPELSSLLSRTTKEILIDQLEGLYIAKYRREAAKYPPHFNADALDSLLYYEETYYIESYTNVKTNRIDVSRLIAGLPPYIEKKSKVRTGFKVIVITPIDASDWMVNKLESAMFRLEGMKDLGMQIYELNDGNPTPYEHNGQKPYSLCLSKPNAADLSINDRVKISRMIGVSQDRITFVDSNNIDLLIEGDNRDWIFMEDFRNIRISLSPISFDSWCALLEAHSEDIVSISIQYSNNLLKNNQPLAQAAKLPNLKKIVLISSSYAYHALSHLRLSLNGLSEFYVSGLNEGGSDGESRIDLLPLLSASLKYFTLENLNLSSVLHLDKLLKRNEKFLISLKLSGLNRSSDYFLDLEDISFDNLRLLGLSHLIVKPDQLSFLLASLRKGSKINLMDVRLLSPVMPSFQMRQFENFDIINCPYTDDQLKVIHQSTCGLGELRIIDENQNEVYHSAQGSSPKYIGVNTQKSSWPLNTQVRFLGKDKSPELNFIRLNSYQEVSLNPDAHGLIDLFMVWPVKADLSNAVDLSTLRCDCLQASLPENHYYGKFSVNLSIEWVALPSISSEDEMKSFYTSFPGRLEIRFDQSSGYHYVRSEGLFRQRTIWIEVVYYVHPDYFRRYESLPDSMKEFFSEFRRYQAGELNFRPNASPMEYFDAILSQRVGLCQTRSIVSLIAFQKRFPGVEIRLIENDIHFFIEVKYNGQWVRVALGGGDADLVIQPSELSQIYDLQKSTNTTNTAENVYSLNLCKDGSIMTLDYLSSAANLVDLKMDSLPPVEDLAAWPDLFQLKELTLDQAQINPVDFKKFLMKVKNITDLTLRNCQILGGLLSDLDLSCLAHIEKITLIGDFVSDLDQLKVLMGRVTTHPKWVIDSPGLINFQVDSAQGLDSAMIEIKRPQVNPVANRYFKTNRKLELLHMVSGREGQILIDTANPRFMRLAVQALCLSTGRTCFYIDSPDELKCQAPCIHREGTKAMFKKGPGGPLYDFLTSNRDDGILIVNFTNFNAEYIVRFNSLLDENRSVDNVPVPPAFKIIGIINRASPGAYQGSDFESRFDLICPLEVNPPEHLHGLPGKAELIPSEETCTIDLSGALGWQSKLTGCWSIDGNSLQFKEGEFLTAIRKGVRHYIFNNPPVGNDAFHRFMDDIYLTNCVYDGGREIMSLPEGYSIRYAHVEISEKFKDYIRPADSSNVNSDCLILSDATVADFLGRYEVDAMSNSLITTPGYLESHQGRTIQFILASELSESVWGSLLEKAAENQVSLVLAATPGIELPSLIISDADKVPRVKFHHRDGVTLQVEAEPQNLDYPEHATVIDISELSTADLLPSITAKFDEHTLSFRFTVSPGILNQALSDNGTVILKGHWTQSLKNEISAFVISRLMSSAVEGHLCLIAGSENDFPYMSITQEPLERKVAEQPINIIADFENRYALVEGVLTSRPFVFIAGPTGVGKTQFVTTNWQKAHPCCHYGLDHVHDWLTDKRPGFKALFIDEANITTREWSEMEGLFLAQPAIFYQGMYYPLTPDHKVIFAGNPNVYGGERGQPSLFKHHQNEIQFQLLPRHVLASLIDGHQAIQEPILSAYEFVSQLDSSDSLITPRELLMMSYLTMATMHKYPSLKAGDVSRYFAYTLARPYVPSRHSDDFDRRFKPSDFMLPHDIDLQNFKVNASNRPCLDALVSHLTLRALRCSSDSPLPPIGGLGGVIIEGEPGLGKSMLVFEILTAQGLREGIDFERIAPSFDRDVKERTLIKCFHEGKIAVIDEINSSPMIERLLNALLEGHDLEGHPPKKPGFMLIGTQNPATYRGRKEMTLPLLHRLQTIIMPTYTHDEKIQILQNCGLPSPIINKMLGEFDSINTSYQRLCFRDLIQVAKRWRDAHSEEIDIQYEMDVENQVGEICKVVAIANVENYYAKLLNFKSIPLHSKGTRDVSLRWLAKQLNSAQGEILSFSIWKSLVEKLGYDAHEVDYEGDIDRFEAAIRENLELNNLPIVAFAVGQDGQPDPKPSDPEGREHAAVIIGYNSHNDTVNLAHWGKTYCVSLSDLFLSTQALVDKRNPEFYQKIQTYRSGTLFSSKKYDLVEQEDEYNRKSITPEPKSGFKGKLLVIKKPENRETLMAKRKDILRRSTAISSTEHHALFKNPNKQWSMWGAAYNQVAGVASKLWSGKWW